jgi:hypothetical protein
MAIVRYTPFAGLEPFPGLRAFEDTIESLVCRAERPTLGTAGGHPRDGKRTGGEADVPDVKFEDIDVRLEKRHLDSPRSAEV